MAAEHFVGMLFWIPVNKAMFTGDDEYAATHELAPMARSAARAFISAYGVQSRSDARNGLPASRIASTLIRF